MKTKKPPFVLILFLLTFFVVAVPGCLNSASQEQPVPADSPHKEQATAVAVPQRLPAPATPPDPMAVPQRLPVPATPPDSNSRSQLKRSDSTGSDGAEVAEIQTAVGQLPKGTFFHNVPPTMDVGQTVIIEAGITNSITNQLLTKLQGQGDLQSRDGIRYDPQSMEIELSADKSKFDVQPISVGRRPPVVNGVPTIWKWQVKPLKQGTQFLNLTAKVKLQVPGIETSYKQDYVVYSEQVEVKGSLGYSLMQLISKHWLNILVGVATFCLGVFAWLFALKPRKLHSTQKVDG